MLRNPEYLEKSWEDLEAEFKENPERPFFAPGATEGERDLFAYSRCQEYNRVPEKHAYIGGGTFYICIEPKSKRRRG